MTKPTGLIVRPDLQYSMRLFFLCCLLLLSHAWPAAAHDPHLSGLRIVSNNGRTTIGVTTHLSRLAAAEGKSRLTDDEIHAALGQRLRLRLGGTPFQAKDPTLIRDEPSDLLMWQASEKGEAGEVAVDERLYPEDPASRLLVTVMQDGEVVQEAFIDAAHPTFPNGGEPPGKAGSVLERFLHEGVVHIFGGPDHVAFVLGLLLLGGTLGQLLKTVTAFTLAHSVTLSLAATGAFDLPPRVVEPVIALSIVVIAVENFRVLRAAPDADPTPLKRDLRAWLAFGFGLIHGFGFAGALAEVGLPQQSLGWALAAFNIGVEAGQLAIVLAVAPVLGWLQRHRTGVHRNLVAGGSALIGAAGAYWFVTRVFGG